MMNRTIGALALLSVMSAGLAATAQAQTIDAAVARHVASKGGAEKWKSIQTQRMTGNGAAGGADFVLVISSKRPNLARHDVTVNIPGQGPLAIVNVFDGTRAWTINPMLGGTAPQEVEGPEAATMRSQSDFDGAFLDYTARGTTIRYVGSETLGTRKVDHLEVTPKGGPTAQYYLDAETGVELKIDANDAMGSVVEMSGHRSIDGILVPQQIRVSQGGQVVSEVHITNVEFNVPMDDALFRLK
jgi:outer membrane lipoprotein-sorting protein